MKFSPYFNHRLFGSPGLLDPSEATHLDLLLLPAPHFDSPCFLLLIRPHLKLFVPSKKKNLLQFVVSFIPAPWILSCAFVCLCSSLSSLFPWLLVACSLTGAGRGAEELPEFLGQRESAHQRGERIPCPSHCNQLLIVEALRDWEWLPEQGRFTSQPPWNLALKLLCKIL